MNPTPYLTFKGNCREAISRYAEIFGGTVETLITGAEMPGMEVPDEMADWIMHSELRFPNGTLMASDDMMGTNPAMAGSWVMMQFPSTEAAKTAFDRLTDGGETTMPFAPTQWSDGFGMVTDAFGIRWMISGPGNMS